MEIILDEWQKEVEEAEGDILLCTGRRVGKTYIMAKKAIDLMVSKPKTPIVIVSLTEDQAMIIHFMALHYLEEKYPGKYDKRNTTLKRLTVKNGSTMITRPVGDTGDAARGFEGGVLIVDEASRMPKLFWLAAKPILLTTNGHIWMCSTPFGKKGYFWEKFNESYNLKKPDARFKVFYKSSEDVMTNRPISRSWTKKQREGAVRILEEDKRDMTELEYGQEYLGLFLEDVNRLFSDEWIKKVCIMEKPDVINRKCRHYMGVDIARLGKDEGTFEILRKINKDKFEHVENLITKKKLTTETEEKIIELEKIYSFKEIGIDAGAGTLGVSVLDHLLNNHFTKKKVTAVNNRTLVQDRDDKSRIHLLKVDLYNNLKAMGERGEIKLLNEDIVKASLASIQYDYLVKEKQKTRLVIFGSYSHIAEGLIRAAWCAAKDKSLNIWVDYI